jgi:hypothetical protein
MYFFLIFEIIFCNAIIILRIFLFFTKHSTPIPTNQTDIDVKEVWFGSSSRVREIHLNRIRPQVIAGEWFDWICKLVWVKENEGRKSLLI